jgi:CheY-like chemotaxis protein
MSMDETNPLRLYVDPILSSSQKAASLTSSLLAFSRQQPVNLTPFNINKNIKGTEKLLKRLLTEDIELETSLAPQDIIIMADATHIDQILFNLATNARDAMKKGGRLTIETRLVEIDNSFRQVYGFGKPGRYALLSIADTGTGMDETTKEKIFEPFFTTKEAGKGTGLGLATVYGIVKQHNGYVDVFSKPGTGTTFHIYLPAAGAIIDEEKIASADIIGGSETILIAEDNEGVRRLLKEVLSKHGYVVLESVDGNDAIDSIKKHPRIDLMILDSVMPKKNGREVYDEARTIIPHVKVIFMSGYTRDIVLDKGIEENDFHFISKPIQCDGLLLKVRKILDS